MKTNGKEPTTSLGEKLRSARKSAGLTQEQLAEKLVVSRQAITKWESGKGMPDIDNLKQLSRLLNVSIDYLLDNGERLDAAVIRESIDLASYPYHRKISGRWIKKAGQKDRVVREKFPRAEIHALVGKQMLTRKEKITDNVIGLLTDAPFGIPQFIHDIQNTDKEFYLVHQDDKQFLVVVTDDYIESRQLTKKITEKTFAMGDFSFTDCGLIPQPK